MDKKNSVGTNKYLLRFPKERPHLSDSMKAIHKDILIANRVRDTDTLMAEVTEEEIEEEFQYCFKKYGLSR